jgi:hypothetical protein
MILRALHPAIFEQPVKKLFQNPAVCAGSGAF